ncbi:hypothetical protein [Aromatoleum anaerobium]|uniref:Uncharacterized protein n=1 Tax=Aromatoleum anaerobium TaxID=182180 RepID=A0ABX1PML4_9RHOO|nr:hypothetical protein [Aromatoleum anaerobium]MCK0507970.1 hypothetical protein [Aromatoleum anaerobium]
MTEYHRWLRAAYLYYIEPGEDTGMSDAEWDSLSRKYLRERDQMTEPEHAPLHRDEFDGGSLFWLRRGEYPACALSHNGQS